MYKDTENIDKGRRSLAGAGRQMSPGLGEGDKAAVMSSSEAPASQRRRAGGLSVCVFVRAVQGSRHLYSNNNNNIITAACAGVCVFLR